RGDHGVDVAVPEQLGDCQALGGVVLDDQQALAARNDKLLQAPERLLEALARRRLGDERERSARERVLAVFVHRQHLDRDVARYGSLPARRSAAAGTTSKRCPSWACCAA